jgi:hypothetical protein
MVVPINVKWTELFETDMTRSQFSIRAAEFASTNRFPGRRTQPNGLFQPSKLLFSFCGQFPSRSDFDVFPGVLDTDSDHLLAKHPRHLRISDGEVQWQLFV